ncbi:hypothetical protein [Spongiactinospora rosea]|uniref:hypothetical protein n=1 Tax=Spongiactinospora rosea TaxID=2248750 RepID=UPI0011C06F3A|nr:hypothetical protein [Spongiactinospora rosea]
MEELLNISDDSLIRFMTRWYGPPSKSPDSTSIDCRVSASRNLMKWHQLAGCWDAEITHQSSAVPLSELAEKNGFIEFWVESQGCWSWAISSDAEDFQVFDRDPEIEEAWAPTSENLPDFLLHATVYEAIIGAPYSKGAEVDFDQLGVITKRFKRFPLPAWRWPSLQHRILVGEDVLALISPKAEGGTDRDTICQLRVVGGSPGKLASIGDEGDIPWVYRSKDESAFRQADEPIPDFLS